MKYLKAGDYTLNLKNPLIMGVINVTPDSFSDGGIYLKIEDAINRAKELIDEGADILDIGGESSRPGAKEISLDEERNRVLPVLEKILPLGIPISVDTQKPKLMYEVAHMGASMINDIRGFSTSESINVVKNTNLALCVMHMQKKPLTMQDDPKYENVTDDIKFFLERNTKSLINAGINQERLIVDPGFGFGKTTRDNIQIFKNLNKFSSLDYPILIGVSRKNFLGELTLTNLKDRLIPSVIAATLAIKKGANIVRVHDVKDTVQALKLLKILG